MKAHVSRRAVARADRVHRVRLRITAHHIPKPMIPDPSENRQWGGSLLRICLAAHGLTDWAWFYVSRPVRREICENFIFAHRPADSDLST